MFTSANNRGDCPSVRVRSPSAGSSNRSPTRSSSCGHLNHGNNTIAAPGYSGDCIWLNCEHTKKRTYVEFLDYVKIITKHAFAVNYWDDELDWDDD